MSEFRVASRYAKSLLELAEEQGRLEEVHSDMKMFSSICEKNRDFVLVLKNPIINHSKKLSILNSIFQGKVNSLTLAIFKIIAKKNREMILPAIAESFHHQYNIRKGVQEATVTTTFALDEKLKNSFKEVVRKTAKKEVELQQQIDEDLIGGFILKIGDQQIDESLKGKIKELILKFGENPYVKEF